MREIPRHQSGDASDSFNLLLPALGPAANSVKGILALHFSALGGGEGVGLGAETGLSVVDHVC